MAIVKSKGTTLKQKLSSVYTTVAQVISLDLPEAEVETFEADYLDQSGAGIPYEQTGRVEGGSCGFEIFYDPALAGHKALTELIRVPQDEDWQILFVDGSSSTWTFTGAGFSFGGTVALSDGLKATGSIKLSGIPTYPTGGSAA